MHKSEKFWRENVMNLNDKNYELLKSVTNTCTLFAVNVVMVVILLEHLKKLKTYLFQIAFPP